MLGLIDDLMGSLLDKFNDELKPNKIEIAKELKLKVKSEAG